MSSTKVSKCSKISFENEVSNSFEKMIFSWFPEFDFFGIPLDECLFWIFLGCSIGVHTAKSKIGKGFRLIALWLSGAVLLEPGWMLLLWSILLCSSVFMEVVFASVSALIRPEGETARQSLIRIQSAFAFSTLQRLAGLFFIAVWSCSVSLNTEAEVWFFFGAFAFAVPHIVLGGVESMWSLAAVRRAFFQLGTGHSAAHMNSLDSSDFQMEDRWVLDWLRQFELSGFRFFPIHLAIIHIGLGFDSALLVLSFLMFVAGFDRGTFSAPEQAQFEEELWVRSPDVSLTLSGGGVREFAPKMQFWGPLGVAYIMSFPVILWWYWVKWQVYWIQILWSIRGRKAQVCQNDSGYQSSSPLRKSTDDRLTWVCAANYTDFRWGQGTDRRLLGQLNALNWAWLYRSWYPSASGGGGRTTADIMSDSDGVIFSVGEGEFQPKRLVEDLFSVVQSPFVCLDVIRAGKCHSDGVEIEDSELRYVLRVLDEDFVGAGDNLGGLIRSGVGELNRRCSRRIEAMGVGSFRYDGGVFDLNVLHRRVHEFPEAASRFLELLNVWELVARWMVVVEGVEEYEQAEETLRISFGKTCSDIRKTAFMQSKLGVPEDGKLMDEVREYWKEAFNWKASMSQNPTVEEAFGWMVYIRNKTRGHGSTSRIKEELYIVVEALTFLLLDRVKDHADLEIMVRDVKEDGTVFFTCRHGMRLDFIKAEDSLVSTLVDAESNVHFRKVGQEDWRTSNLLKAEKGHVFLLNEIRKGHREWVCFSTGELIRPASIFDA